LNATDFTGSVMARATLDDTNLTGALLVDVNLRRATLRNADLTGARIEGSDLRGADFSGATFTGATTITTVLHDRSTVWPDGFDPPLVDTAVESSFLAQPDWEHYWHKYGPSHP
jgi:hypothetical protein